MGYVLRKRRHLVAAVAAVCVVAAGVAWLVWGRGPDRVHARNVSRNYRACLLVSSSDTRDAGQVDAVWKGLVAAAATGRVNAQRFQVPKTDIAEALPYVNGAVAQRCDVLVATGSGLTPALRVVADSAKNQQILVVNGGSESGGNLTALSAAGQDAVTAQTRSWVLGRAGGG